MASRFLFLGLVLVFGRAARADYNPILLQNSSYNQDMVVEKTAVPPAQTLVTATMDAGTNVAGLAAGGGVGGNQGSFFEYGFIFQNSSGQGGGSGLPIHGFAFTATNNGNVYTFRMAPDYTTNDAIFVGGYGTVPTQVSSGALNFASNTILYTSLSVLAAAGSGPTPVGYTVNHADGTAESGTLTIPDWAATAAPDTNNTVFIENGNFQGSDGSTANLGLSPKIPRLYHVDIALSDTTSPATNLVFNYTANSGNRAAIFALSGLASGTNFTPLTVTGYNADMIVENPLMTKLTATMDAGTNLTGNTWFETGYAYTNSQAWTGLPVHGSSFNAWSNANVTFQMPPSYVGNDALLCGDVTPVVHNGGYVTLSLNSPAAYTNLAVLNASGFSGGANINYIVNYSDGTSNTGSFYAPDWTTAVATNLTHLAYTAAGRINVNELGVGNVGVAQYGELFYNFLVLSNVTAQVTSVQFENTTAGGRECVFSLSGAGSGGKTYSPIAVSGYNEDAVVEAAAITNMTFRRATTATMDSGTNDVNTTWCEQGWNPLNPASGLPAAGSILSSTNQPTYHYQLAPSWTAANAVLCNSNNPVANITFQTPHSYVGLSFLYADGNGPVQVKVIVNHQTVSPETNVFNSVDWLNTTAAAAFSAGGRANSDNRSANNWLPGSSGVPRLYDAQFTVANSSDPVTGVTFIWSTNNGSSGVSKANSSFVVMAAAGDSGTYAAPVIGQQPVSLSVWSGINATFAVTATGFPAPTYQWFQGSTLIAGGTNATYTLPNAQLADSGATYSCTISNSQGFITSTAATLTVVSAPTQPYPAAIIADQPLAYWRLDEGPDNGVGNDGVIANDFAGGHDGYYSNVVLQVAGYNTNADADAAAGFGIVQPTDSYVAGIPGIDFTAPSLAAVTFSVEAWVLGGTNMAQEPNGAGIITKGYGNGGEQFNLDCGGGGGSQFRFYVHNASGGLSTVNGTSSTTSASGPFPNANGVGGSWHHLVGVCDGIHSNLVLYVDGISNAAVVMLPNGIQSSTWPVSIGSRQGSMATDYDHQFMGTIDEVAIYNYALTPAQVLNHYNAAEPLPVFALQPTNTTASEGGPLALYASAYGPGVAYQWYQSADMATWAPVAGQNSATFSTASAPDSYNNSPYFEVVATNLYGSTTSSVATVSLAILPQISSDLPPSVIVYAGATISLSVTAYGALPLTYIWTCNGTNIPANPRISGLQSNVLTIANSLPGDSGNYYVTVTNSAGSINSGTANVTVEAQAQFNGDGTGWGLNGGSSIGNDALTLTDGGGAESRSAWYAFPLYIGAFQASFTYQDMGGDGADGLAFVVQNDPRGMAALGTDGNSLGYGGNGSIQDSVAMLLNIYNASGIFIGTNGVGTSAYASMAPVDLRAGNPVNVNVIYTGGVLQVALYDTVAAVTFTTNIVINIPATVRTNTAWVGFTGSDGGTTSDQVVSDFTFVPLPVLASQITSTNTILLSWPASVGGFTLQSQADLGDANPADWVPVTAPITQTNGLNQVMVTPTGNMQFYQLVVP